MSKWQYKKSDKRQYKWFCHHCHLKVRQGLSPCHFLETQGDKVVTFIETMWQRCHRCHFFTEHYKFVLRSIISNFWSFFRWQHYQPWQVATSGDKLSPEMTSCHHRNKLSPNLIRILTSDSESRFRIRYLLGFWIGFRIRILIRILNPDSESEVRIRIQNPD